VEHPRRCRPARRRSTSINGVGSAAIGFRSRGRHSWPGADCGIGPGDKVDVALEPEGPQRDHLADDLAQALAAEPAAAAFFDGLARYDRNAYLEWIDGTKRRPDLRASRIAEVVELLKAGARDGLSDPPPFVAAAVVPSLAKGPESGPI
jgi:hypothetical protein